MGSTSRPYGAECWSYALQNFKQSDLFEAEDAESASETLL